MPMQSLVDRLNGISHLFALGLPPENESALCDVFGPNLDFPLSLIGENRERFRSAVDDLLNTLPRMRGTVSRNLVRDILIPQIREKKISKSPFTPGEANLFGRKLCDLPLQKLRVIRPIFGVDMSRDAGPVQFGDFFIDFGRRFLASVGDRPEAALTLTKVRRPG